ncbi:unnamed protein product [Bursaphelenchus okinawaensis]|uniref:SH3 domain-containing protein n=1 Tax=Bursaphelenchus okinawaensis TaxID=465554 RepID=A0A811KEJ7_9BILA|nr:unnamed protein product [Bursaphelenchus okinawaensis]CAG9103224.1 unnamed protein product [Bursaphelenchus okinawaensis]
MVAFNGVERVVGEETEVKHVPLTTQNSDRGRDTHILHVNHNINGVQDTKPYSNGVQGSQQETSRRDSHHNVNIRYVGPIHVDTTEKAEDTKYQPTAGFVGNDPIIVDRNDAYHSEIIADEAEEVTPIITQDIRPVVVDVEDHDRTGRNEYIVHTTTTYTQSEKQTSKNPSAPSTPHSVRRTDNVQTASVQTEAQAVPIVPVERVAVKPVDVASHSPPRQRYSCRSYEEETRPQPRHEYEYLAGAKRPKVLPPGIYKPTPITGLLPKDNYDNKQNDRYEKFENRYQNASYHPQYVRPNNVYDTDRPFSRHSRQNSEVLGYHTRNHSVDSVNFNQPIPLAGMHSLRQPPPKYIKPSDAPRPLFSTSNYGRWLEVVTSYEAQGEHQLSLNSGDRIKLIKSGTRGWVLGRTIEGRCVINWHSRFKANHFGLRSDQTFTLQKCGSCNLFRHKILVLNSLIVLI